MRDDLREETAHEIASATLRMAALVYAAYLSVNLPSNIYTAMRSRPLYLFPDHPVLGAALVWFLQIVALLVFFFLSGPFAKLALRGMNVRTSFTRDINTGLGSIALLAFAISLFVNGFHELIDVLTFAFNDTIGWNPFSGSAPNLFYKSIEAALNFVFAYAFAFKKKWLLEIGSRSQGSD